MIPTIILKSLILFSLWRKEKLFWISCFHLSGRVPNCYAGLLNQFRNGLILKNKLWKKKTQALNRVLNIRLKLKGEFEQLLQFLNQLKSGPRLLVMEKLQLENTTPALVEPKLSIEMILSAHRRL